MIPLLVAAVLLIGSSPWSYAQTLVYCSEGSPEGFDPALYTSGTTFDASSRQIYNRLVEFEPGTTNIRPALAESWEVSDDSLEYTFNLRQDTAFHTTDWFTPSRPFDADDVIFTFERQWKEDHSYHGISGGTYEYFDAMGLQDVLESIEKVDDHTVKFVLNRPEAPFIANMGMDFASILSAEYADQMMAAGTPEQVDLQPVGTGPFQFVAYQKDAVIRYQAHPDYWDGKAPLDNVIFAITPDASVRWQKLQAGECHIMPYPNPADLDAMRNHPDIEVLEQEGLNVGYLAFNTEKAPFDNVRVRQALNMAVNKDAIIEAVFQGAGKVAKNPIPPTIWSYNEDVEDYPYDPDQARQILEEEGVTDLQTDIWAMPVQQPYNPNAPRMAELIQADWANVGVTAEIVSFEWGEYLKRSLQGEHETVLLGWTGDNGDPDNFLYVLLSCDAVKGGANRARWCHEQFDELLIQAKMTTDAAERAELYGEAQVMFKKEAPWIPLAHSLTYTPVRKEVVGLKADPFGGHYFYGVSLEAPIKPTPPSQEPIYNVIIDPLLSQIPPVLQDNKRTEIRFFIGPKDIQSALPSEKWTVNPEILQRDEVALTVTMTCLVCPADSVQTRAITYSGRTRSSSEATYRIVPSQDLAQGPSSSGQITFTVAGQGVEYDHFVLDVFVGTAPRQASNDLPPSRQAIWTDTPPAETGPDLTISIHQNGPNGMLGIHLLPHLRALKDRFERRHLTDEGDFRTFATGIANPTELHRIVDGIYLEVRDTIEKHNPLLSKIFSGDPTAPPELSPGVEMQFEEEDTKEVLTVLFNNGARLYDEVFLQDATLADLMGELVSLSVEGRPLRILIETSGVHAPWQYLHAPGPGGPSSEEFWGFKYELTVRPNHGRAPGV